MDRFSKADHFIPLPKLLSAKQMAQLMVHHIFQLHGLPDMDLRPWSLVLIPIMEGFLYAHWVVGQPVLRVSP